MFGGDFDATADPVLTEIEQRLSWQPQKHLPTDQRIAKVGLALLSLKEMEYLGRTYADALADRMQRLIDRLLCPLEEEWFGAAAKGSVIPRVKALRMKIMPEMVQGRIERQERQRRWRQLADIYLAQQISNYPPDYLAPSLGGSPAGDDRALRRGPDGPRARARASEGDHRGGAADSGEPPARPPCGGGSADGWISNGSCRGCWTDWPANRRLYRARCA